MEASRPLSGRVVLAGRHRGPAQQVLRRNSYDYGDWFNELDPSLPSNGFGKGLPPAASNQALVALRAAAVGQPGAEPNPHDLLAAERQSEMLLKVRATSPLLRLGKASLIQQKLSFPNSGPTPRPGSSSKASMTPSDPTSTALKGMVIVFNASPRTTTQTTAGAADKQYR